MSELASAPSASGLASTTVAAPRLVTIPDHVATSTPPAWALELPDRRQVPWFEELSRRVFDVVFATAALVLTLPVLAAITLLLATTTSGSPLYVQRRVGRHGRSFGCLKFRTMHPDAEERLGELLAADPARAREFALTQKLKDDPRVTAVGRVLRRLSLDELPQFANVLAGHMSVVGPRPVTTPELAHYGTHVWELLSIRPGITGLWQVSGRSDLSYEQRVVLDLGYVRRRSLVTDAVIVVRTVGRLLRPSRSGAC